jgi:hypothetical protein
MRPITAELRTKVAWIYIDESRAPHAAAVELNEPFWIGAMTTAHEIDQAAIASALRTLRNDPDAAGDERDKETLARGYSHASGDSKNAHSAICQSIVNANLSAALCASQWFFGRDDSEDHEGARLHRLVALLASEATMQADFDTVHMIVG